MRSILEEFAYGNVSPEARFFKRKSAYGQAFSAVVSNEGKLRDKLSGVEKEWLEKLVDAQGCYFSQKMRRKDGKGSEINRIK